MALVFVQAELIDDLLQARAAEDLLADGLQALHYITVDGVAHEVSRHLLRVNADDGGRFVIPRQIYADNGHGAGDKHGGQKDPPLPAQRDLYVISDLWRTSLHKCLLS